MAEKPILGDSSSPSVSEHALEPAGLTRRQLIIGAGALFGAAALASSPLWREAGASVARAVRPAVGVVAPPTLRYPLLLEQLSEGVRRGLIAGGQSDVPVLPRTATSSAPSHVAASARELVKREKVDLVLVYGNPTRTSELDELVSDTGASVVVVDPGAQIVTSADAPKKVLAHSLGYWQSVWALGAWAAASGGKRVQVISSFYESGFDVLGSFAHGLAAKGGEVVGTAITHRASGDLAAAVKAAAVSRVDAIFVAAAGDEARDIFSALAGDKTAAGMALLVPGLAVAQLAGVVGLEGHTALTWPVARASAFEMLGHDIGAIVAAAVDGGAEALPAGAVSHEGERGAIELDLATGRTDLPIRIHSLASGSGAATLKPIGSSGSTAEASVHADDIVGELRTGWLDVYGGSL